MAWLRQPRYPVLYEFSRGASQESSRLPSRSASRVGARRPPSKLPADSQTMYEQQLLQSMQRLQQQHYGSDGRGRFSEHAGASADDLRSTRGSWSPFAYVNEQDSFRGASRLAGFHREEARAKGRRELEARAGRDSTDAGRMSPWSVADNDTFTPLPPPAAQ